MVGNLDRLADLVPDILSMLPVKSLMRFKSVHKSWYDLITNSDFISKHLHTFNEINSRNSNLLLVKRTRPATFGPEDLDRKAFVSLFSFDLSSKTSSLNLLDLIYNKNEVVHVEIFGPCNGIYCIYSIPVILINPSMRESKVIPQIHLPPGTYFIQRYPGFGFDTRTNDYKIVLIMDSWRQDTDERLPWRAEMYSLSSNCWKEPESPLPSVHVWNYTWIDSYVHGACHWWAYDDTGDVILAFDIFDEMFRIIKFPETQEEGTCGTVAKFKDSIAVFIYPMRQTEKWFDLWVMEEYGNEGSWIKHLTIGPVERVERPLGFWKNDTMLLLEDSNGRMLCYVPESQEIIFTGFHGEKGSLQVAVYMESLVSLRGNTEQTQAGWSSFDMVSDPLFD